MYNKINISVLLITIGILLITVGCNKKGGNKTTSKQTSAEIKQILSDISADSIKHDIHKLVSFKTRHTLSDTTSDSVGIGAARRWIYHKMKTYSQNAGGRLKVRYDGYTQQPTHRINKPTRIVDIVAVLPGTQPGAKKRMYVVSGHYDSRVTDIMNDSSFAPGADDDASGTAAVMEMARVMSHHKFDATLVFMTVAGEEQGLFGSNHYAKEAKKNHKDIAGMLNNDIIGNNKGPKGSTMHSVRVFAQGIPPHDTLSTYDRMLLYTGGENDTPPRELGRFIHGVAKQYMPNFNVNLIYRLDRYLRGGDQYSFVKQGYPAVRFTEPSENYHHQHADVRKENGIQYGDLPKFVNYNYNANVARVNAASLAMLANAPARPRQVHIEVQKLENNTTLNWKADKAPDLKGYEIVWRKTHAPYWQHSKFVGDTTRFTIKNVSKDNYLFGVRSVDSSGYHSPAVYPLPARH
ncbi:MAG TPA: M20/M25/M40 family metallo-hydrolase [Balneolaceae bacterium]|nr:M20/M25/M40 family metallo-hydrolase [Balneolaceae bacterium]